MGGIGFLGHPHEDTKGNGASRQDALYIQSCERLKAVLPIPSAPMFMGAAFIGAMVRRRLV